MAKTKREDMTTVMILKEQHAKIKAIAEREGKKVERVVQEIIEKGLEKMN
ncbi:MAG: hypothetical protein H6564_24675 [Lewinellaceae bacterium]|nr:hypothetical protein [Lewinellaceae bacterium]